MKMIKCILLSTGLFLACGFSYAGTVHTIAKGQTLSSVARQYGVSIADIKKANPGLDVDKISIGQKIKIPGGEKSTTATKSTAAPTVVKNTTAQNTKSVATHIVEKGETGYAICRKYNITLDQLKSWNNMTDNNFKIGQVLQVAPPKNEGTMASKPVKQNTTMAANGSAATTTANTSTQVSTTPVKTAVIKTNADEDVTDPTIHRADVRSNDAPHSMNQAEASAIYNMNEVSNLPMQDQFAAYGSNANLTKRSIKGVANSLPDANDGAPTVALYSGCPIGSILKVRNLMNNKTIYVKVVGKLPDADQSKDISVKISGSAAKALGALDERFLTEVTSFVPKN